jgi:hypothetical protein
MLILFRFLTDRRELKVVEIGSRAGSPNRPRHFNHQIPPRPLKRVFEYSKMASVVTVVFGGLGSTVTNNVARDPSKRAL